VSLQLLSELFSEWLAGGTPEEAARARLQAIRSQAVLQLLGAQGGRNTAKSCF